MALQDGLLSFQIKETIFLSSDKEGIGELKELELLPDVEIIESPTEISIAGCLQLYGKYEPTKNAADDVSSGSDTLVSAMKFTPFQLEQNGPGPFLYGTDLNLSHRIPLNITIPVNRIGEVGEIYAIVDSFDYQLESPNQLLIEADLKIAGITLADHESDQTENAEETWEFVHVAGDLDGPAYQPATLDEIERKLTALEEEIEQQERVHDQYEAESSYAAPYYSNEYEVTAHLEKHEVEYPKEFGDISFVSQQEKQEHIEAVEAETAEAEAEQQIDDFTEMEQESVEDIAPYEETEVSQVVADEEVVVQLAEEETDESQDEASAEEPNSQQPVESKELKVAISGKPISEEKGSLNLTSIFSQARRPQEMQGEEYESSSGSSRRGTGFEGNGASLKEVHNLTSFIRSKEERYSRMKLCIIQRNETLEIISTRYALPISRILEVNKLTSDRITEGQILYIPQ